MLSISISPLHYSICSKIPFCAQGELTEAAAVAISEKRRWQFLGNNIPANTVFQKPEEFLLCSLVSNANLVAVAR